MKNSFGMLISDAKDFLCSEANRIFVAVLICGTLICYFQYRTECILASMQTQNKIDNQRIISEVKTTRDKVHFRYFNLTKSLEEIHNVEINTLNGKLEK